MNIYKLFQGTTFENLKSFIYLTNEYGKPSQKYIDSFMENFGEEILGNKFKFTAQSLKEMNYFWQDLQQECTNNKISFTCNHGSLFYYVIGTKVVEVLKDTFGEESWNSMKSKDRLFYLKVIIESFDTYLTDEYKTDFNNFMTKVSNVQQPTPQLQQSKTNKKLTKKEAQAAEVLAMLQSLGINSTEFITRQYVLDYVKQYIKENILVNSEDRSIVELTDYSGQSIFCDWNYNTGELKEIPGTDHSALTSEQLDELEESLNTAYKLNELENLPKQNSMLDSNGNVAYKDNPDRLIPYAVIDYDDLKKYESKQPVPSIKHYSLVDEYIEGSENSLIGVPLYIKKKKLGTIVSNTEIKTITGEVIDLGEYIYKNNIADPTDLNTEYTFFIETYKEI